MRGLGLFVLLAVVGSPLLASGGECDLRIAVVDVEGNPGQAGLVVRIASTASNYSATRRIDQSGFVEFPGAACDSLSVSAGVVYPGGSEVFQAYASTSVPAGPRHDRTISLIVPELARVVLDARDPDGLPVIGVSASLFYLASPDQFFPSILLVSNSLGRADGFLVRGASYRWTYGYRRSPDEDLQAIFDGQRVEEPAIVSVNSADVKLDLRLDDIGHVAGVVRSVEGEVLPRMFVELLGEDSAPLVHSLVDAEHRFALSVASFPATIRVRDTEDAWLFDPETATVGADSDEELVFLARRDDSPRIAGRVVRAKTDSGVDGIAVFATWVCPGGDRGSVSVETDFEGRFRVPCHESCSYQLTAGPAGSLLNGESRFESDACSEQVVLELRQGARIHGRVKGVTGLGPDDLTVWAEPAKGLGGASSVDAEGNYGVDGLRLAEYRLFLRGAKGLAVVDSNGKIPKVKLRTEDDLVEIDLTAVEAGELCLRLENSAGSAISPGAVSLFETATSDSAEFVVRTRTSVDEVCASTVPPGNFYVRAGGWHLDYVPTWWPGEEDKLLATEVEIESGEPTRIGPMVVRESGRVVFAFPSPVQLDADSAIQIRKPCPQPAVDGVRVDCGEWTLVGREQFAKDSRDPRRVNVVGTPVGVWDLRLCLGSKCVGDSEWVSVQGVRISTGASEIIDVSPGHANGE